MFLCDVAQALMPAASALHADACLRRYQGEAIALIPENAARVALVVGEHRKAAAPPRTVETQVGGRLGGIDHNGGNFSARKCPVAENSSVCETEGRSYPRNGSLVHSSRDKQIGRAHV